MQPLPQQDLDHIWTHTWPLWEELRNQRLFITGGTGFFGCWLLESFVWANTQLGLNASATVLTRDPKAFAGKAPHLALDPAIHLLQGDVRSFAFPEGEYPYVIHAGTEASLRQTASPDEMLSTIVEGTRRVLDFAAKRGTHKLLLTSSGAVYGVQPSELTHVPESYSGGPDPLDPRSVYGEGKRLAEQMCALAAAGSALSCKIARCFAFAGPHLPIGTHFAIGEFIVEALAGRPIRIHGDGTPHRSYLYAADLAIWLWTILLKGSSLRAYNVGSEESITIRDLARETVAVFRELKGRPEVQICLEQRPVPGAPVLRYVPRTARAREELALYQHVGLRESIRRTAEWFAMNHQELAQPGN